MFVNFYYQLKSEGIPVSLNEWMMLMEALAKGLAFSSLTGFYYLARAILVKNERHFDRYDVAFAKHFEGIEASPDLIEEAMRWLKDAQEAKLVPFDQRTPMLDWSLEELRQQLAERLKEQNEEHYGGTKWISSGAGSPFGHSGYHPAGVRIGGSSNNQSAVQVAAARQYRDLRDDKITSVRQFEVALRKLRQLSSRLEGPKDELDIDETINATCKHAGMLRLVWERPRRNKMKLIILMDSGGSMDPYRQICSRLFTAANRTTHFKEMRFYYFHNCIYDRIYTNFNLKDWITLDDLFKTLNSDYRLLIVGDASMARSELTRIGGSVDWALSNEHTGLYWLKRLAGHFPYAVWLNPLPVNVWPFHSTVPMVKEVFPMYHLSPEGLEQAVQKLKTKN